MSNRALQRKHGVGFRTVTAALESAWPKERKQPPKRGSRLDAYRVVIDDWLRSDLDAPRKQRHTAKRIFDRLLDEHDGAGVVSYWMVREYVDDWYAPAARAAARANADGYQPARELAAYRVRLNQAWPRVQVVGVDASGLPDTPEVGAEMTVRAAVQLAGLQPEDVTVQAVVGRVGETDDLADTVTVAMQHVGEADGDGDRFDWSRRGEEQHPYAAGRRG